MSANDQTLSLIIILSILSIIFTLLIVLEKYFLQSNIPLETFTYLNQRVFQQFRENLNEILALRQVSTFIIHLLLHFSFRNH